MHVAHALAKANVKKATKWQMRGYGESSCGGCSLHGDSVWRVYPLVSGGKLHYKTEGVIKGKSCHLQDLMPC